MSQAFDLARVRHDNALRLFDEFVQAHVKSADAATLRGLERRFAERLQIQPSYWSQIKARSRQIGERLARQFEQLCHKPAGWMDQIQPSQDAPLPPAMAGSNQAHPAGTGSPPEAPPPSQPLDDDERFIVGLVLTYYRRHPQRARARLLDLLGEVLTPEPGRDPGLTPARTPIKGSPGARAVRNDLPPPAIAPAPVRSGPPVATPTAPAAASAPTADDDLGLWQRSQAGVSPLPRKR